MIKSLDQLKAAFSGSDVSSFPDKRLPEDQMVDQYVQRRVLRSLDRLEEILPNIEERYEFWRGNQYAYVTAENTIAFHPTKTTKTGAGKKPWLSRKVNNLLMDIVAHEVSASTQRVPSYEVTPTAVDPEKRSAAKTSEQVALYGYEQWGVLLATTKAVTHAVVGGEAFAWPYFDNTVGPMIRGADGSVTGMGEIKIKIYGPEDVVWEPGIRFEDSPYHIVKQTTTLQEVVNIEGFLGGNVPSDADLRDSGRRGYMKARNQDLVTVYHYLEKPTKSYPVGRWLVIAGGRQIARERPYPVMEGEALIPLSYIVDPDNDRDQSLLQHLLDPQRIYNDAWNKIVEWKNLALNPQLFVAPGVLRGQEITSRPGAVYEIADPTNNIRWREVPQLPQELFQIVQETNAVIARLAAQNDIPQQVEAGRAIQTLIERDAARRQAFIARLAQWYAKVANASLVLVQEHYTEKRLIQIKGRWGAETIKDFYGAKLQGQVDVRVAPGSIEPRTREAMEQKVFAYADRGWITAEQAMAAIDGGYAAELVSSYELDIGRITRVISRLKAGPDALYGSVDNPAPSRTEIDPQTGVQTEVPDFMPRLFDNIPVQRSVMEDWMKTEEFESQPTDIQATANEIYLAMLKIENDKQAQEQLAMEAAAQAKGAQNAAQSGGGVPEQPDATSANPGAQGGPATPNQPANQSVPDRGMPA